jgi:hypothetical protein
MATQWRSLGGILMSEPAALWSLRGYWCAAGVFHRGTDDVIYTAHLQNLADDSAWTSWIPLPNRLSWEPDYPTGAGTPAAVLLNQRIEVFDRDIDNSLWHVVSPPNTSPWTPGVWASVDWKPLGGILTGDPVAAFQLPGRFGTDRDITSVSVFHRGTDNACHHRFSQTADPGGAWTPWRSLGGTMMGDPVVARNEDGRLEVFHRGTDNKLYHRWQTNPADPGSWSPQWDSLGGTLAGQPAAVVNAAEGVSVFHRGTDSGLYHRFFSAQGPQSGQWSSWTRIAIGLTGDPSVAFARMPSGAGNLAVAYRGAQSQIYFARQALGSKPPDPWTETNIGGVASGDPLLARGAASGSLFVTYRAIDSSLNVSDRLETAQ